MVEFQLKNKTTTDLDFKILKSNHYQRPKQRFEQISIPGRTGDLIINEKCSENFEVNIECYIVNDLVDGAINEIEEWLKSNDYENIEFNDGITLKCYFINLEILEKVNRTSRVFAINFTCYKEDK